jgi:Nif-specific regulatory protein
MLAYLVIREGTKWTDVFRLVPGRTVTVGRAQTNQIVIKDERCSRCHAELFCSEGSWIVRDLESRNGTSIGAQSIRGDYVLTPGDVVRIGQSQLAFVSDLSKAFPDSSVLPKSARELVNEQPPAANSDSDASVLEDPEPATITHRRQKTRYLAPASEDESLPAGKGGHAAANLCRLAFSLAKATDLATMARLTLDGLFEATTIDAGAILLLPRGHEGEPQAADLEVIASKTNDNATYYRVSNFLAQTVLREEEAVLARNVMGDSTIGIRDSQGQIHATSVICAPVGRGSRVSGLIHLYSTTPEKAPDPDDLEYTLAVAETVAVALENLNRRQDLTEKLIRVRDENVQLREKLGVESEIVGNSKVVGQILNEVARAAPSKATVLIRGESGVGKELVARAVHFSSPRKKGPFVCLNCAALSRSLLPSELFGHEQGAFTGATQRKIGKFEAAHLGTLMLDEIGEMSSGLQAKFLRVLEGHPFERVGGTDPVKVDVRVIAATNRDLERDVAEGRFRRDLYFRLRVLEIVVPPLRKRADDVPELVQFFIQRYNAELGRKIRGVTAVALDLLKSYRWPGNIRELKNVIERAVVLCHSDVIDVEDLTLSALGTPGDSSVLPAAPAFRPSTLDEMEREHILKTLLSTNWNKSQTATILGIERSTLDRKIRRFELKEERRRSTS